jgi:regulator of protease activity HflC (stomatin/prohibitin superfamily)
MDPFTYVILFFVVVGLLSSLRVIFEYQRGILFTLGKYTRVMNPGLRLVIPILQSMQKVDLRIATIDIPKQEVMTKDNVPVNVNAVVYFKVIKPEDAILKIQDYNYALSQYAQTALRDVAGGISLDQLLIEREKIAGTIKRIVDKETDQWGIDVTAIKIQDIELPTDMKRSMARQAEAEREKRATIIKAEGEKVASLNLSKAAAVLAKAPGALHLRTLQTINDVSPDQSNTIIFAVPMEVLDAFKKFGKK